MKRAVDSGFDVRILTVDTWQLGWRSDDVTSSNYAFYHGIGADLGLSDFVFKQRLQEAGIDAKKQPNEAGAKWIDNVWHGRAHSWGKLPWVIKIWKELSGGRPFCLKGLQFVIDAQRTVEYGVDGIVVSNHAGRQVDGVIASLDALEKIVGVVSSKCTVVFDSGVRTGSDVFKALALDAKCVFVDPLWGWGLSIMGETGVRHVMKSLLADLDILMEVGGFRGLREIDKTAIESYAKDYQLLPVKSQLQAKSIGSQLETIDEMILSPSVEL